MIDKYILFLCAVTVIRGHAISEQKLIRHFESKERHDENVHHHGSLHHIGSEKPVQHEEYAASFPSYEFSYKVDDPHTKDHKYQHEVRHGDVVKGVYSLLQPDGKTRTVKYYADDHTGFKATVHYSHPHEHVETGEGPKKEEIIKPVHEKEQFYFNHIHESPRRENKNKELNENREQEKDEGERTRIPLMLYQYGLTEESERQPEPVKERQQEDVGLPIVSRIEKHGKYVTLQNEDNRAREENEDRERQDRREQEDFSRIPVKSNEYRPHKAHKPYHEPAHIHYEKPWIKVEERRESEENGEREEGRREYNPFPIVREKQERNRVERPKEEEREEPRREEPRREEPRREEPRREEPRREEPRREEPRGEDPRREQQRDHHKKPIHIKVNHHEDIKPNVHHVEHYEYKHAYEQRRPELEEVADVYRIKDEDIKKIPNKSRYYGPGSSSHNYERRNKKFEIPKLLNLREKHEQHDRRWQ